VRIRFGSQRFLVVTEPRITEHILLTAVADYPRDRRLMALNRGPGPELMFNTDRWDEWKWRRRTLTPAFHRKVVAGFGERVVSHARSAAEDWSRVGHIDLEQAMRDVTMRTILDTMFSVTDAAEVKRLQTSFEVSSEVVAARAAAPVPVPWWLPTPTNLRLRALTRYRWGVLSGMVFDRMREPPGERDLLDLLLAVGADDDEHRFELPDLVGEMSGIVFAGHETTAQTLTWLFAELDDRPDLVARLLEEIEDVLGNRDPTVDDLPSMPFTDAVIQETLRLHPPVYLTIREADADHRVGDVEIPRGSRLVINIRGLHRDPDAWLDAEAFIPDRFIDAGPPHRFQYLPFLAGPKKCLGDTFAMNEMRLVVPTILRRVELAATSGRPVASAGFTLSTANGFPVSVTPRSSVRPRGPTSPS
jgi:cytochrome P450